jgi:drug/metabolite transporter (DMT)-like permease
MQIRTKAHIAVIAANLFYGINFSVMKYVTGHLMHPIALNVLRVLGATILFWVMGFWQKTGNRISKKHYFRFFVCALTGVLINQILFVKGVSLTTNIRASLLMLVCPIAVVFIAAFVIKERITGSKIAGLLLGTAGAVILISMKEPTAAGENLILGDIFIIINAISYAFYLVWVKPLMQHYNAVTVIRWVFTIAFLMMLPMGVGDLTEIKWAGFQWIDFAAIGFIIVAVTFCTFLFNIYGVKILGSTITGAYIYSQPLFAALIAILVTNDNQNLWLKLLAAVLIFAGVYLVSVKKGAVHVKPQSG